MMTTRLADTTRDSFPGNPSYGPVVRLVNEPRARGYTGPAFRPREVSIQLVAIVLAAGEGRRIGGPKALLHIGDSSFLAHVARLLARPGVASVVAVLGHEAERVAAEAALPAGVTTLVNRDYRGGMLTSVWRGLDAAEHADAVLLHPVDHPLVQPATVDGVVAALAAGARIAVPSHEGRRGHPAGFARSVFAALRAAPLERGARQVLADHPEWVTHVHGDPGCRAGIDAPADYERWIGPLTPAARPPQ
jgi:molybdenum cofactor cytidylyltransferase